MNILPTELNRRLSECVRNRIAGENSLIAGRIHFWRFVGLGLAAFGIGTAVGISFYGYAFVTKNTDNMNSVASTLSKALADIQLHATAEGTVQIEPREIALAKGQTISLAQNSRVLLEPGSRVLADGEVRVERIVSAPSPNTRRPVAAAPVIIDFTVFKSVPFDKGTVMTGWRFETSTQKAPVSQYCYYTEDAQMPGVSVTLDIGKNEELESPKTLPKNFDLAAAFNRCVWFRS
jgi:hypothetical protein